MSILFSLPEDILTQITTLLAPRDLLSLSLSSRLLHQSLTTSDPIWLSQCLFLLPNQSLLATWRSSTPSYFSLFRFLFSVSPLIGLWVHQNPELGNVVHVLYGQSLSVVACRIIPQEFSRTLLWAPVFEIFPDCDGKRLLFTLYGDGDCVFPGNVATVCKGCNVMLLEVDCGEEQGRFGKLAFGDRRRLLDAVAGKVRVTDGAGDFFENDDDEKMRRRLRLIEMHKESGGGRVNWRTAQILETIEKSRGRNGGASNGNGGKKRSLISVVKQIIGRTNSSSNVAALSSVGETKHLHLSEFLKGGDSVGLRLRATNMRLTMYRAWPNMHDNRFALYKLPLQEPLVGKEYAGLWGGTFGWPPGKTSVDKPGKALFFILISYEEIDGNDLLIATKILEGTHYVLHPNGSAMFIVKVDEPALDSFPWERDGDDVPVEVKNSYAGEGISNGYGFRYPGSKPGALFEMQNGNLAFVWKESRAVLTLKRLDLEDMLKNGERVPALPPIANFAYLTKSYSNVFAGFPGNTSCSPAPR